MLKLNENLPTPFNGTSVLSKAPARSRRRWFWSLGAVPFLLAAGFGVTKFRGEPPAQPPASLTGEAPAVKAQTVRPVRQTIRKIIEQPGRIEGYEQTPVHVKIPGFVESWKADIGQRVAEGEVLAELSVPEEREELKRREASVELARAEVTNAEAALDAARADETRADAIVTQAKAAKARADANAARWVAEFRRVSELTARGVSSMTDHDTAQDQFKTTQAAVKEAEAAIAAATAAKVSATAARVKTEAGVSVAKAKLDVSTADARRQAEWLKYATVKAPFAGVVVQRNVDRGQYVTPPASGSVQTPLFVVVRTEAVRVFVEVPETEATLVTEKMAVTVRIQAHGDREILGTVSRFSWALDASTRTLRVQIDLPNLDGTLRPGMFASARFVTERAGAWVVPTGVISTAEEQQFAVRIEAGKGLKTPVKLGARQNGMVELLQKQTRPTVKGEPVAWEPLTGSEEFLTARPAGWADGAPIELAR